MIGLGTINLCKKGECHEVSAQLMNPSGLISRKIFKTDDQQTHNFLFVTQKYTDQVAVYEIEYDHRLGIL